MRYGIATVVLAGIAILTSCAKKDNQQAQQPAAQTPATAAAPAAQPGGGPHAFVNLKDGSRVPGTIVASTQTDMVVAGDDGIERKIPMTQVKSVDYGDAQPTAAPAPQRRPEPRQVARQEAPAASAPAASAPAPQAAEPAPQAAAPRPPAPVAPPAVTYVLRAGTQLSVRTNEAIDSGTAAEGQTFSAQITRDVKNADGEVVIPRGSAARVAILSASKGGHFRGASDLTLDLKSVDIGGREYLVDTAAVSQKGKAGVGANKRTAEFAGGGAALGAIIGAIAGGGKGAAIGAGSGAGAGALTQILTKGGAIKVPVESVLTFQLDRPLRVTAAQ